MTAAEDFGEKIACLKSILELHPDATVIGAPWEDSQSARAVAHHLVDEIFAARLRAEEETRWEINADRAAMGLD